MCCLQMWQWVSLVAQWAQHTWPQLNTWLGGLSIQMPHWVPAASLLLLSVTACAFIFFFWRFFCDLVIAVAAVAVVAVSLNALLEFIVNKLKVKTKCSINIQHFLLPKLYWPRGGIMYTTVAWRRWCFSAIIFSTVFTSICFIPGAMQNVHYQVCFALTITKNQI